MGQQQLLLIIVGVIITGIAVAVGITIFQANAAGQNRDAVWSDLNHLGAKAQQYFRKPHALGGGDRSFTGFKISRKEAENDNGMYYVTADPLEVKIKGYGREIGNDNTNLVTVNLVVHPDTMYVDESLGFN